MAVERNWEFGQSHGIETCARELEAVLDAEAEARTHCTGAFLQPGKFAQAGTKRETPDGLR